MKCKECEYFSPFNDAVKRAYRSSARADSVEKCGLCRLHGSDFETAEDSLCRRVEFREKGKSGYKRTLWLLIVAAVVLFVIAFARFALIYFNISAKTLF